jgi:hypothetical protein
MIWIWGAVLARVRGTHPAAFLYLVGRFSRDQGTSVPQTQLGAKTCDGGETVARGSNG